MCNFGHIHTHTEYSALDGMGKVEELILTAKELGQNFIAITDHGSTSALWEAQQAGDKHGIKVIHGCEYYYESERDGENSHLLILAKNNEGLKNMFKMQEKAYVENFHKKPRINWEILQEHSEGLIVTSACLGSPFNQYLINGEVTEAKQWARKFKELFGEDFYIEIQPNQLPEQHLCNKYSIEIAKELGIEVVATNDVHYTLESDCFPHEVLLAMQVKKKMSDENRFKFPTNDFWLKSREEMVETFEGLPPDVVENALSNTQVIADKCNPRIEKGRYLPKFYDVPEGETQRSILERLVEEGLEKRGYNNDQEYVKDTNNEIDIIDRNGYSGYFLIVQDFVTSAKRRNEVVGDGRGSGAGSKVAYITGITEIPPHEYDLLFERFMSDGRSPDFDVDFSDQDAVFEDLQQKYGHRNVARISAFGRMTPRAVIRRVMSAFEHPTYLLSELSKLVPELCKSMEDAYKASPELLEYKKKFKTEFEVIERLQNVISHETQHAGGVIIYPNLSEILPVLSRSDNREKLIVGFDKDMLEEMGHYKFDILGLETLPIVRRCLDSIREVEGIDIDLSKINLEDQHVYDMLCSGDVSGVFQINQQAQKVIEQQPRNFRDLIAINALIRPGVGDWDEYVQRRRGKTWAKDPNRPWMHETMGTMTYQEQFLLDCHHLAGWSIAYADSKVRKNKDIRNDTELRNEFIHSVTLHGHQEEYAKKLWSEIEDAVDGGYSFNKSHSASYAMLSYQTAWLKCNYPLHFYASLMTGEKTDGDGQSQIAGHIAECKARGISVLPPDINNSGDTFSVDKGSIRYRITTIKHVGSSAISHIEELRPIKSFDDFLERREKKHIRQNVFVNLIKAGVFDFDNPNRAELLWKLDMHNRTKTQIKEGYECPAHEWNDKIKSEWEREVLGMYLSSHPLEKYGFHSLDSFQDGQVCIQGGEVTDMRVFKDKNQNEMAFVTIDTLYGNVKCIVFASTWKYNNIRELFQIGNTLLIKGKRSANDMIVNGVELLC